MSKTQAYKKRKALRALNEVRDSSFIASLCATGGKRTGRSTKTVEKAACRDLRKSQYKPSTWIKINP